MAWLEKRANKGAASYEETFSRLFFSTTQVLQHVFQLAPRGRSLEPLAPRREGDTSPRRSSRSAFARRTRVLVLKSRICPSQHAHTRTWSITGEISSLSLSLSPLSPPVVARSPRDQEREREPAFFKISLAAAACATPSRRTPLFPRPQSRLFDRVKGDLEFRTPSSAREGGDRPSL